MLKRRYVTISIMKQRFGSLSLLFTAFALPISILTGAIANYGYKKSNSRNLDITASSAYLNDILVVMAITLVSLMLIGVVFSLISLKTSVQTNQAKLSLILVVFTIVIVSGAGVIQQQTNKLEKTDQKNQIDTFFKQLSQ